VVARLLNERGGHQVEIEEVIQVLRELQARKSELDTREAELDGRANELDARQAEFDARQADFVAQLAKFDEDISRINSVLQGVAIIQQRERTDPATVAEASVIGKPH
jgi:hypothetical protein